MSRAVTPTTSCGLGAASPRKPTDRPETKRVIVACRHMQRVHLVRVIADNGEHQIWLAATARDKAVDAVLEVVPEGWSGRPN